MDKLRMQTLDGVQDNIDKIAALFPNCILQNGKMPKVKLL